VFGFCVVVRSVDCWVAVDRALMSCARMVDVFLMYAFGSKIGPGARFVSGHART